jgi:hypothetical protein
LAAGALTSSDVDATRLLGPVKMLPVEFDAPPVSPHATPIIATATTDAKTVNRFMCSP